MKRAPSDVHRRCSTNAHRASPTAARSPGMESFPRPNGAVDAVLPRILANATAQRKASWSQAVVLAQLSSAKPIPTITLVFTAGEVRRGATIFLRVFAAAQ